MDHETLPEGALPDPGQGRAIVQVAVTTSDGAVVMAATYDIGPFDDATLVALELLHAAPYERVEPHRAVLMQTVQRTLF